MPRAPEAGSHGLAKQNAELLQIGTRTFRLMESEPLETSCGVDLYREVVEGEVAQPVPGKAANDGDLVAS